MLPDHSETEQEPGDIALAWIARFRSGAATAEDRQNFSLWLSQSVDNKRAMDAMLDMWADLGSVKQLYESHQAALPKRAANSARWLGVGAACAACFALALVLWPGSTTPTDPQHFQTATGEQRTIQLEDSSTLILNTASQVSVQYSNKRRSLKLLDGEVYFTVSKDADRPFEVNAGTARVTAVGTAFNIHRQGEHASIVVSEGVVSVTDIVHSTGNAATILLHAGQQLEAGPSGLGVASSADLERELAWQRGELVAREMNLLELTHQIERYHDVDILLADSEVASMTLSGAFAIGELEPILEAVQLTLGLEIVSVNDSTLLLLKPSQ